MDAELIEFLQAHGYNIIDQDNSDNITEITLAKDTETSYTQVQITVSSDEVPTIQVGPAPSATPNISQD